MGFDQAHFHADCGQLLELEQQAETPEASFWYCPRCDVYTNDTKTANPT